MRYPYEVRKEADYFDDIPDEKITKDMLDLAKHIVETKKAHFEPDRFEDRYEEALKDLLKKKQSGQKIEAPREREPSKVVNLMDALRRSVETERGGERRKPARAAGNASRAQEGRALERAGEEGRLASVTRSARRKTVATHSVRSPPQPTPACRGLVEFILPEAGKPAAGWGRGWGWGQLLADASRAATTTPLPTLPHKGGGSRLPLPLDSHIAGNSAVFDRRHRRSRINGARWQS